MNKAYRKVIINLSLILLLISAVLPDKIQIIFLFASLVIGLFGIKKDEIYKRKEAFYLCSFCVLFTVFIISSITSQNIKFAFDIVLRRVALMLFPLLAFLNVYSNISLKRMYVMIVAVVGVFTAAVFLFTSYNLLQNDVFKINFLQSPVFYIQEILNNYKHRTYINTFLLLVLIFTLSVLNFKRSIRIYIIVLGILLSTFIVFTGSRAGFLSVFVVWFLWGISRVKTSRKYLAVSILIVGIFLFVGLFFMENDSRFKVMNQVENSSGVTAGGRLAIWKNSGELIRSNWLLGVGLGDAKEELVQTYVKNGFHDGVKQSLNCHNQYLQLIVESGIISMLLFLFLLIYPYWIFKSKKNKWVWINISIVFGLNLFFEVYLNRIAGVVLLAFLPILFVILHKEDSLDKKDNIGGKNSFLKFIVNVNLIAVLMLFVVIVISVISYELDPDDPATYATQPYALVNNLPGDKPASFSNDTKGYRLDSLSVPILGNGHAYAYTKIGNRNVVQGDSLLLSVWFYADSSFNGDFVGISYGGNTNMEKPFYQLKNYPRGVWQKLSLKIECNDGKAPAYFYFAKKGNDFNELRGSVIFARPIYTLKLK